jgi:hypothetical protein
MQLTYRYTSSELRASPRDCEIRFSERGEKKCVEQALYHFLFLPPRYPGDLALQLQPVRGHCSLYVATARSPGGMDGAWEAGRPQEPCVESRPANSYTTATVSCTSRGGLHGRSELCNQKEDGFFS